MNCFIERVAPSRSCLDVAPFSTMRNARAYIIGYVLSGNLFPVFLVILIISRVVSPMLSSSVKVSPLSHHFIS